MSNLRSIVPGLLLAGVAFWVSCDTPNPPDGVIACAVGETRSCPHGYQCVDGLCFHNGYSPADMSVDTGDAGSDMGGTPDLVYNPCTNGLQDPGETDLDCGGSCPPCAATKKCNAAADCVTASCTSGVCTLVSGPPNWLAVPSLQTTRAQHGMAADGAGRIYVFGGVKDSMSTSATTTERYTPGAAAWEVLPNVLGNHGSGFGSATDGKGRPCAIAGHNPDTDAELDCFDSASNAWVALAPIPNGTSDFATASAGGIIYTFGGVNTGMQAYAYSAASNAWVATLMMPEARSYQAAATGTDGLVYVIGGNDGANAVIDTAQVYNPTTNAWAAAKTAKMSTPRSSLVAAGGGDGRIFAIGGFGTGGTGNPLATVEAYTPATNTWATIAPLTDARAYSGVAVGADGRIYVAGGSNSYNLNPIASVEAYGPVSKLSSSTGAAGAQVTASGSNFAVNATVNVYFDAVSGPPIATGKTDAVGVLSGVTFAVPALASGAHRVIIVDVRSQFPSYESFTIVP